MIPCPHSARHLVSSLSTLSWTLGASFTESFEEGRASGQAREKPIYALARLGYETLFKLTSPDKEYVSERLSELRNHTIGGPMGGTAADAGITIGIHVRHGDRHPLDFTYKDSYIPLDKYLSTARTLLTDTFTAPKTHEGEEPEENMMAEMHSLLVVASDDPEVYASEEFSHAFRAQEQIRLASKKVLQNEERKGKPTFPGSLIRGFIDETVGWEGGFFSGMFWSLGKPNNPSAPLSTVTSVAGDPVIDGSATSSSVAKEGAYLRPSEETMRMRELVGRAYLMDLAVLGGSDRVVCTVSSMGCRILAVMMGWENAFGDGETGSKWTNIDGEFTWKGVGW
jgi:hypothetical protein